MACPAYASLDAPGEPEQLGRPMKNMIHVRHHHHHATLTGGGSDVRA